MDIDLTYSLMCSNLKNSSSYFAFLCAGDWLKYGYIDASTQAFLTAGAAAGTLFHGVIAAIAAAPPAKRGQGGAALAAFARGFFCGTPELLRVLNRREAAAE